MVEAAAPPARQAAPPPGKRRDPWFDNAKMALIVLVVIGHSWTLLPKNTVDDWLYDFLYAWHIPAFVVVTGYLSRSFEWTRRRMWSLCTTVALPYVVFEGLYAYFRHEFGGVEFERLWANPHWPMWYLAALFFWRLATPLFKRLPGKVVIAVAISLVAGLYANDILDNARILGLLPFFVLGLKMHEGHWTMLRTRRARWWGAATLIGILVLAWLCSTQGWVETEWLYYRTRYDALDPNDMRAITIRMLLLLTGLCGAFAFFAVVPRTRTWFSTLGSATLVVYLFHGFFVLGAEFNGFMGWAEDHWPFSLLLTTALSVVLAIGLAWGPVSRRLNVVVDPIGAISRRRRGQAPSSG
jgi:fucose 4-O-acetylase-like acetyltransferase